MAPSSTSKGDYSAPSASSSSTARKSNKRQGPSAPPVDPGYGDSLSDEEGGYAGGRGGGDTGGAAPLVKASKKDKADKVRRPPHSSLPISPIRQLFLFIV